MKVILRENMENLGEKGDIVSVSKGYARNYLIPKRLAVQVTKSNIKMIEMEQKALKKRLAKELKTYEDLIQSLNATKLSFLRKAGEKDVIFGSVSSSDIKEALVEKGFAIDKKKIVLDEPLKRLGNFMVPIKIHQDKKAEIAVEVLREEGETGGEEEEITGAVAEEPGVEAGSEEEKKE